MFGMSIMKGMKKRILSSKWSTLGEDNRKVLSFHSSESADEAPRDDAIFDLGIIFCVTAAFRIIEVSERERPD